MPDPSAMSAADLREIVLFAVLGGLLLLLLLLQTARRREAVVPPTVSPVLMPVEDQVRDVRHRVANVEQKTAILDDHAIRVRAVEREVQEIRGRMDALKVGQEHLSQSLGRIERQIDTLVDHHIDREQKG